MGPIPSSNGTSNMSCSTDASRSAGGKVSRTIRTAQTDRVGHEDLVLGVELAGAPDARHRIG